MNVLLLGNGGREHALAYKIAQSPQCDALFIAPGNPGTALCGKNIAIAVTDFFGIAAFCLQQQVTMIVVGPEDPLVLGIVDYFLADKTLQHIAVIGPNKMAAQMEGSKLFAKQFMQRHGIATAAHQQFDAASLQQGLDYILQHPLPIVLKADGLAAGKGVVIANSHEEAANEFKGMLAGKFGEASSRVVIETFLTGVELTVIILTDGQHYLILPTSKDYKRVGDGDAGLNTGGMGAVSPPPFATPHFMQLVEEEIIKPTLNGLRTDGISYQGFLYFGLIKVGDSPFVIEYNCRMGDPETQVIMPRIKNDLLALFNAVVQQKIDLQTIEIDSRITATIIMASYGYPGIFEVGKLITGIEQVEDAIIFQASTLVDSAQQLTTNGGRVIAVTSYGNTIEEALRNCYINTARIYFETRYFRRDIGYDLV